jgi:hypothetical protein
MYLFAGVAALACRAEEEPVRIVEGPAGSADAAATEMRDGGSNGVESGRSASPGLPDGVAVAQDAPSSPALEAPVLVSIEPMAGGLHMTWSAPTACDEIAVYRSKDGGAFALVAMLPPYLGFFHDVEARAPGSYCYTATCVVSGEESPDSNELCGTPEAP